MPLSPLEHDRRYGELDQVMRAYAGQPADDTPDKPSGALVAYLRHTWHTRPWALAVAERQLREYAAILRADSGCAWASSTRSPTSDRPEGDIQRVAEPASPTTSSTASSRAKSRRHSSPPPTGNGTPASRKPAQFLGGWFSQDMPDEFADHDAAVADYVATTDPHLVARLVGELRTNCSPSPWTRPTTPWPSPNWAWRYGPPEEPFSHGAWFQPLAATLSGI